MKILISVTLPPAFNILGGNVVNASGLLSSCCQTAFCCLLSNPGSLNFPGGHGWFRTSDLLNVSQALSH